MKMMEMSVNDSLDRSTWKAPDSSQHSENHRNDDTKLIEPSELHQLTSEVENTKLNNLLTTPLSKMSHSEMNELAQELSNRIDHVEGLQEKESSELFLENNKRNIGETKHRSFDQDAVPSVSNFLRNMRDMDNNARRSYSRISRLEDPLLKSENIEENDSLNPTDKSLQNRIRSNTSNNNSAEESVELKGKKNQITTSIAHWLQYFCCCHERWFLKRFVKYLRSWNTQILVFTLYIVGSILIVIHFLIMHFIGQQNKRNSISQPEHITPLLLVGGYASHGLLLSWCLIVLVIVAKSITRWNVRQMWAFYLLSAVLLGCVYRFYLTVDPDGISLPEGWGINHNQQFTYVRDFKNFSKWHNHDTFSPSPSSSSSSFKYSIAPVASEIQLSVLCIYFSITTQTSVGFGDIVPIAIPIRIISALHMFIGMVYGSMLVGLTMESDMSILIEYRHKHLTKQLKRLKRWRELQQSKYNYKMGFNDNGVHYGNSIYNTDGLSCCAKLWIQIKYIMMGCCYDYQGRCTCEFIRNCVRHSIVRKIRRFLRAYLLTFNTVVVVVMNIALTLRVQGSYANCTLTDDTCTDNGTLDDRTLLIATLVHIILLFVLLSVSMKYVKRTESVTIPFLCCSFLATCLIFGSMYTLLTLHDNHAFTHSTHYAEALKQRKGEKHTISNLLNFLGHEFFTLQYYSMTTMTTTGFGFVHPNSIVAMIMVMCQELLSFLFATYVLGVGIQSVATAIEMKKNPNKYKGLNEDLDLSQNISILLSGKGDPFQLRDDEKKTATLDLLFRKSDANEKYSTSYEDRNQRQRRGTATLNQLQDKISELESLHVQFTS